MRKQKRYDSESEIMAAIDECHSRSKEYLDQADQKELEWGGHDEAEKLRKRATRRIEVKANKLGKTLAAFRTDTMIPILVRDRSVVAA